MRFLVSQVVQCIVVKACQRLAVACLGVLLPTLAGCGPADDANTAPCSPCSSRLLYADNFRDLTNWFIELEDGGDVAVHDGVLDIDVPGGCTVWFRPKLTGPVAIEYDAVAIQAGGKQDRVSDLNCFWMASDPGHPDDLFAHPRDGSFQAYDTLFTYYVGLGGNRNTTTRFRRYIGKHDDRPLLPENDRRERELMLVANQRQKILLVADGSHIRYFRDGEQLFYYYDPQPYTTGWFGLRTTKSHLQIRDFRVYELRR